MCTLLCRAGDVRQALQDTEAAAAAGDHERCAGVWAVDGSHRQRPGVHSWVHAVGSPHPWLGDLANHACRRLHCVQYLKPARLLTEALVINQAAHQKRWLQKLRGVRYINEEKGVTMGEEDQECISRGISRDSPFGRPVLPQQDEL